MAKYRAFISYSQHDKKWARRIHRALESYRVPLGLNIDGLADKRRLGRFFRDDEELAGAASLGAAIEGALDNSESLIVICSPNAAASNWVNEEVRRFKAAYGANQVFAVIVDGKPNASGTDNPDEECFPLALRHVVTPNGMITNQPDEPLAPDTQKESFSRVTARLIAGFLGIDFDALWQRESRRIQQRRLVTGSLAVILFAVVLAGWLALRDSQHNQLHEESLRLASEAQAAMDERRMDDAMALLLRALPKSLDHPDRPVTGSAIAALNRLMADNPANGVVVRFPQTPVSLTPLDPDRVGIKLATGEVYRVMQGEAQAVSLPIEAPRLGWLGRPGFLGYAFTNELQNSDGKYSFDTSALTIDISTGKTRRLSFVDPTGNWFMTATAISPAGTRLLARGSAAQKGALAIFNLPPEGAAQPAGPEFHTDPTFLPQDAFIYAGFADEDSLVFSWGKRNKGLALWYLGQAPRLLRAPGAKLECAGNVTNDIQRRDVVSLSFDRSIVAHAQPMDEEDWCVRLWSTADGKELELIYLQGVKNSSIVPVSENLILFVKKSGFGTTAIYHRSGDVQHLNGCRTVLSISLSLVPSEDYFVFSPDLSSVACAKGQKVWLYDLANGGRVELADNIGEITAFAFSLTGDRLWSVSEDGTLRYWNMRAHRMIHLGRSIQPRVSIWKNHVAMVSWTSKGTTRLGVYAPDGSEILAPIPFSLLPEPQGGPTRNISVTLLGDGKTVAIAEGFFCRLLIGKAEPTPCHHAKRRLTLIEARNGEILARINGLSWWTSGPVAMSISKTRDEALIHMKDGSLQIIDVTNGTVRKAPPLPNGFFAGALAHAHGKWWVLAHNNPQDPYNRKLTLFKSNGTTDWQAQGTWPGLEGKLFSGSDGQGLLAFLRQIDRTDGVVISDGRTYPLSYATPQKALNTFPARVLFPQGASNAIMLFDEYSRLAPLEVDLATGNAKSLSSVSMIRTGPNLLTTDSRETRLAWFRDNNLRLLELAPPERFCSSVAVGKIEKAWLSPDGRLLAVKHYRRDVQIFDLDNCAVIRNLPAPGAGAVFFADDNHLWITDKTGAQRIITLRGDPAALLAELRRRASPQ